MFFLCSFLSKAFTAKLEDHRESIGSVNETARALIRTANSSSSANINRLVLNLNQRWDDIASNAEARHAALEVCT